MQYDRTLLVADPRHPEPKKCVGAGRGEGAWIGGAWPGWSRLLLPAWSA
jgi:hypothetical protein